MYKFKKIFAASNNVYDVTTVRHQQRGRGARVRSPLGGGEHDHVRRQQHQVREHFRRQVAQGVGVGHTRRFQSWCFEQFIYLYLLFSYLN